MNCLVHTVTGEILVERLLVRATFWGRLRGLLFHRRLETGSAMLLIATRRVHTLGVLFPLDLYFFNRSMQLIESQHHIRPWMLPKSPEGTKHILEIHNKAVTQPLRLNKGEQVSIRWKILP